MPTRSDNNISLIVGLGNPGEEYDKTRHNVGFEIVNELLKALPGSFKESHLYTSMIFQGRFKGQNIFLQKPLTFMNLSGKAVAPLMRKSDIRAENLLLIYDDMDLPLGTIRIRLSGSSAGHNGVQSVIDELGTSKFARMRIGIGRQQGKEQVDHVLSGFSEDEGGVLKQVVKVSIDAVKLALSRGLKQAMNEYNGSCIELCDEAKIKNNKN